MIETKKAVIYVTGDGEEHNTLDDAKLHDLRFLFPAENEKDIASLILAAADRVIDILTTKERSRPRARKINGGKKVKKSSPVPGKETEK